MGSERMNSNDKIKKKSWKFRFWEKQSDSVQLNHFEDNNKTHMIFVGWRDIGNNKKINLRKKET